MNYIDAMYELSLQCIQLGEIEEAAKWIEKGIIAARKDDRYKGMLYLLLSLRYKYFEERDVYKKFTRNRSSSFL